MTASARFLVSVEAEFAYAHRLLSSGDTLVADTTGFNDQSWLDDPGHPHTTALHVIERFRRKDFGHMEIQVTIDDPEAYTRSWTVTENFDLLPDTDLLENICENEKDFQHLVGK